MRKFILGLILGLLFGITITATWATMSSNMNDRRYDQYIEVNGRTALLVTAVE